MRAFDQPFKLGESFGGIDGQIRIHVVIILDGIRRTGTAFYNFRIILGNSVLGVIAD